MIEKIVLDYLNQELSVPAYIEKPASVPSKYVLIEKTGSGQNITLKDATFAIQSCGKSLYETVALNEAVKTAMSEMTDAVNSVLKCTLNSDYNYTDTAAKEYRYQAVFDIIHY